jgi:hypothetical protein
MKNKKHIKVFSLSSRAALFLLSAGMLAYSILLTQAEITWNRIAAMCPARFIPLYELAKLYDATGRKDDGYAIAMAKKIVEKDVKIPSPAVTAIKNEMRRLIEAQETLLVPVNSDRTSDELKDNTTRQGETPAPDDASAVALPP